MNSRIFENHVVRVFFPDINDNVAIAVYTGSQQLTLTPAYVGLDHL